MFSSHRTQNDTSVYLYYGDHVVHAEQASVTRFIWSTCETVVWYFVWHTQQQITSTQPIYQPQPQMRQICFQQRVENEQIGRYHYKSSNVQHSRHYYVTGKKPAGLRPQLTSLFVLCTAYTKIDEHVRSSKPFESISSKGHLLMTISFSSYSYIKNTRRQF